MVNDDNTENYGGSRFSSSALGNIIQVNYFSWGNVIPFCKLFSCKEIEFNTSANSIEIISADKDEIEI